MKTIFFIVKARGVTKMYVTTLGKIYFGLFSNSWTLWACMCTLSSDVGCKWEKYHLLVVVFSSQNINEIFTKFNHLLQISIPTIITLENHVKWLMVCSTWLIVLCTLYYNNQGSCANICTLMMANYTIMHWTSLQPVSHWTKQLKGTFIAEHHCWQ